MTSFARTVFAGALALLLGTAAATAQPYESEIVGFEEGSFDQQGDQEIFRNPQVSGSTQGILANTSGVENNNTARRSSTWGGAYDTSDISYEVLWEWADDTDPTAWVRLTTIDTVERPNPSLDTTGQIQFDIANNSLDDFPTVGFCVGIRETGVDVPQLADGGISGGIEWVGVDETDSIIECGTNGCDVLTQVLDDDFTVTTNGITWIDRGPDDQLDSTAGGDDEARYGYFRDAHSHKIPIPVVSLPVTFDWSTVVVDLASGDISVDQGSGPTNYPGGIVDFANGDDVLNAPGNRGTLEHFAFTKIPGPNEKRVDLAIDNIQFFANQTDPAVPPTVVSPIIDEQDFVTVTNLQHSVDRVYLLRDGNTVGFQDVSSNGDVTFDLTGIEAQTGEIFTAKQREGYSGDVSAESLGVKVSSGPPQYTFSIVVDETGDGSCDFGWEFVGVSDVLNATIDNVAKKIPQGTTAIIPDDGVWQTIDIPLNNDAEIFAWLGGNGTLDPSPTGVWTMDSLWFSIAPDAGSNSWELFIDRVEAIDSNGMVGKTLLSMEDGVNRLPQARGQSPIESGYTTNLSTLASFDGTTSHRLTWTFEDPEPVNINQALGILQRVGTGCGTSEEFPDTSTALRFHFLARAQTQNPLIPLPSVVGPIIVGSQDTVRVLNAVNADSVQLYIDGDPVGGPVTPTGTETDFSGLTLTPGQSVSATQTIGTNGTSDLAYPRGVSAAPLPPVIVAPLPPGSEEVTVTRVDASPFATASTVEIYVNGMFTTNGPAGTDTVVLTLDALMQDDVVTAKQIVNGETSDFSEPVTVDFPAPVFYAAPPANASSVGLLALYPGVDSVTVATTNGVKSFTTPVPPGADRVDVPVSGLAMGDVLVATQTAGSITSPESDKEVVTTSVRTEIIAQDTFETYADQAAMESFWTEGGTPDVLLATDKNATCPSGTQSAYGSDGTAYMYHATGNLIPTATEPVVLNVNFYDSVGVDTGNLLSNWVELNSLAGGGDSFYMHIGGWRLAGLDRTTYDFRATGNGGPGWVDLDQYDAPQRSIGWHNFTVMHKGYRIDVYVDGKLSRKNIPLVAETTYSRADIGSGYASYAPSWFDDFTVVTGPLEFNCIAPQAPAPPSLRTPIVDGDETVTLTNVDPGAISATVYDGNDLPIGTAPIVNTTGVLEVTLSRALVGQERIYATQTNVIDESDASTIIEVGTGHGPIKLAVGVSDSDGIEWIGVDAKTNGYPEVVPTSLAPSNGWKTVTFDPLSLNITGFTGNGVLNAAAGNLEHLAIIVDAAAMDRSSGPYRMYIDNVVNVGAGAGGSDVVITDFEGFDLDTEVLFQEPGYSGSTSSNLAALPNASVASDNFANGGTQSDLITWFWKDTEPSRWIRLTASGSPQVPSRIVDFTKPIRMDILLLEECPTADGDMDGDCDIDDDDWMQFVTCADGPAIGADLDCVCADFNEDGRVDLIDMDIFQRRYTNGAALPNCP